jgi:uncharacterized membrane protein
LNEQLDELMSEIKRTANRVRHRLKKIQEKIEEEENQANQSADFRIKKTQVYKCSNCRGHVRRKKLIKIIKYKKK